MSKFGRILLSVLLVAFVSALAPITAQAAITAVKMALADDGSMDAADCGDCATADGALTMSCDMVCPLSPLAILSATGEYFASDAAHRRAGTAYGLAGRTGPPEPYPPQAAILLS